MKRIIIQIPDGTLKELDEAAKESGSRSSFVRQAIEAFLAERRRSRELQEVARSFQRQPQEDLTTPKSKVRRAWPE